MIDNYDSFTFNIARYFRELDAVVEVYRNDQVSVEQIAAKKPAAIIVSPGPCSPSEAGISVPAIRHFAGQLPILGICLGHQSIVQAFGGSIVRAREVMHGKTSAMWHNHLGIFKGLPSPFIAARYHSLVVDRESLPGAFEETAWAESPSGVREIMAIRHRELPIEGVQFHPEAILSECGHQLLRNFLDYLEV